MCLLGGLVQPEIYKYIAKMSNLAYFGLISLRSASRRPFGPLVSGQRWIRVPPVGCRRQIAIWGFHGPLCSRFLSDFGPKWPVFADFDRF